MGLSCSACACDKETPGKRAKKYPPGFGMMHPRQLKAPGRSYSSSSMPRSSDYHKVDGDSYSASQSIPGERMSTTDAPQQDAKASSFVPTTEERLAAENAALTKELQRFHSQLRQVAAENGELRAQFQGLSAELLKTQLQAKEVENVVLRRQANPELEGKNQFNAANGGAQLQTVGYMPELKDGYMPEFKNGMLGQGHGNRDSSLSCGFGDPVFESVWKTPPVFSSSGSFVLPTDAGEQSKAGFSCAAPEVPSSEMSKQFSEPILGTGTNGGWKETLGAAVSGIRLHDLRMQGASGSRPDANSMQMPTESPGDRTKFHGAGQSVAPELKDLRLSELQRQIPQESSRRYGVQSVPSTQVMRDSSRVQTAPAPTHTVPGAMKNLTLPIAARRRSV
eukprot:gnl/MRDRNA2_/MRDRNA2_127371_c0_seq1.p1 gnl/MRDRNA2_/MRDRNA2_127371_c0~~gnl/MRDRNA2_/MRDRNA2_127371_c0_seq1.p1  ORF type:complete len:393 (-),score=73.21 gnl/MRDRNA2_/MRDRNA2_127371_c0_seq1:126-1304(-)